MVSPKTSSRCKSPLSHHLKHFLEGTSGKTMPTTEIISVGAKYRPHTPKLDIFAQRCESVLVSDRGLFQEILNTLEGTIIHLGQFDNESLQEAFWFCGHVEEYPSAPNYDYFRYEASAFQELILLLDIMQKASPTGHGIFLTDYQFGPENSEIQRLESINEFIKLNAIGKIRFNTLYHINLNSEISQQ